MSAVPDEDGVRVHSPEHGGELHVITSSARGRDLANRRHAKAREQLDSDIADASEQAIKRQSVREVLREAGLREAEEVTNKLRDGEVGKLARTVALNFLTQTINMEAKSAKEAAEVARLALQMARLEEGKYDGNEVAAAVTDTLKATVDRLRKQRGAA